MRTVLINSADPSAADAIEKAVEKNSMRYRTVSAVAKAKEWSGLQTFDLLFADARAGAGDVLELCQEVWKNSPFCLCAIFNPDNTIGEELAARMLGCRVFSGKSALLEIKEFLENLPEFQADSAEFAVLVVEDLDSPRDIIVRYVEQLGFNNVAGAPSVHEALKLLRKEKNRYFAVVTDLMMPNESGLDLIREVRSDPDLAPLPVIVLTAYGTGDKLVECLAAGASGFLVKPPHKKALLKELQRAKRVFLARESPRLCRPEDAHLIEEALAHLG